VDVIDEAQQDLAGGNLTRARDRLLAALRTNPASQPVLDLLAYTYLLMGDRASAGAAWFLTAKADDDPTASAAFQALEATHRSPIALARALPINAPSEYYPHRARARLERLTTAVPQTDRTGCRRATPFTSTTSASMPTTSSTTTSRVPTRGEADGLCSSGLWPR